MFRLIKQCLLKELRYYYPTPFTWISIILNDLIVLAVFWYTAKAFVPNSEFLDGNKTTYFNYIVIGLIAVRLPSFAMTIFTRKIKDATIEKTFDTFLLLPWHQITPVLIDGLIATIFELVKIAITLTLAMTLFQLPVTNLLQLFLIQLIAFPTFIGLGLIAAAIFLRFGRGEALLGKLTSLAGILAGAYFPTTVFPQAFSSVLSYLSPFNVLMEATRSSTINMTSIVLLIGYGLLSCLFGALLLTGSYNHYRSKGTPLFFRS